MNKKLVAIAVAGVLAAPLAQAQTANVTLYGRMNLDMEVVNPNGDKSKGGVDNNIYRVTSNSSRFGVKGTEALGGGLSAIFRSKARSSASRRHIAAAKRSSACKAAGERSRWVTSCPRTTTSRRFSPASRR
jgi:predicted porin